MAGSRADRIGGTFRPSWLCPTYADWRRLEDLAPTVARVRVFSLAVLAPALITMVAQVPGSGMRLLVAGAAGLLLGVNVVTSYLPDDPWHPVVSTALLHLLVCIAVAITGGATSPVLSWGVLPVLAFVTRYRAAVSLLAAAFGVVQLLLACLLAQPAQVFPGWLYLLCAVAMMFVAVITTLGLQYGEGLSRRASQTDQLTGLPNRKGFEALSAELVGRRVPGQREQPHSAVLYCDIDHFKLINDAHGHPVGDEVLQCIGERLQGAVRVGDPVFRFGGEEFVVVLSDVTLDTAKASAERLRVAVGATPVLVTGYGELPVTISIGLAAGRRSPAELTHAADAALYVAKHDGRNCVRVAPQTD
jgi:diguanylate cyclase (GGDEF)-like protein